MLQLLLSVWEWLKKRGLTHAVALALGVAVALGFAYCQGKQAGVAKEKVAATDQAIKEVHKDEAAEVEKGKAINRGSDDRAAHDYLLDLARRNESAARSH